MFTVETRGHLTVVGSAGRVADAMETWIQAGACDGFNVAPGADAANARQLRFLT